MYSINWNTTPDRESRTLTIPVLSKSSYLPMTKQCTNAQFVTQEVAGPRNLRNQQTYTSHQANGLYGTAPDIGTTLRLPTNSVIKTMVRLSMRPTLEDSDPTNPTYVAPFGGSIELRIPNSPLITEQMVETFLAELVAQFWLDGQIILPSLMAGSLDVLR